MTAVLRSLSAAHRRRGARSLPPWSEAAWVPPTCCGLAAGVALGAGGAVLALLGSTVARFATYDIADKPVEHVLRLAVPALLPVVVAAPVAYVLSRMLVL